MQEEEKEEEEENFGAFVERCCEACRLVFYKASSKLDKTNGGSKF